MMNNKAIIGSTLIIILLLIPLYSITQNNREQPKSKKGKTNKSGYTGAERKVYIKNMLETAYAPVLYNDDDEKYKQYPELEPNTDDYYYFNNVSAIKIENREYSITKGQSYHIIEELNEQKKKQITIVHIVEE